MENYAVRASLNITKDRIRKEMQHKSCVSFNRYSQWLFFAAGEFAQFTPWEKKYPVFSQTDVWTYQVCKPAQLLASAVRGAKGKQESLAALPGWSRQEPAALSAHLLWGSRSSQLHPAPKIHRCFITEPRGCSPAWHTLQLLLHPFPGPTPQLINRLLIIPGNAELAAQPALTPGSGHSRKQQSTAHEL